MTLEIVLQPWQAALRCSRPCIALFVLGSPSGQGALWRLLGNVLFAAFWATAVCHDCVFCSAPLGSLLSCCSLSSALVAAASDGKVLACHQWTGAQGLLVAQAAVGACSKAMFYASAPGCYGREPALSVLPPSVPSFYFAEPASSGPAHKASVIQ